MSKRKYMESVSLEIPGEIWTIVLEYCIKNEYSHRWVAWTLVSTRFYKAIYGMSRVFLNIQSFENLDASAVISRFTFLKRLVILPFDGELRLPLLKNLEKLKIVNLYGVTYSCVSSPCHGRHNFSTLVPENLPSLRFLSFHHCCYKMLDMYSIPLAIRQRITHLHSNGLFSVDAKVEYNFPNLLFLKSLQTEFLMSREFSEKLQEIRCTGKQGFVNFTGKCRIYQSRASNSTKKRSYKYGMMMNGKMVGEWKWCGEPEKCI